MSVGIVRVAKFGGGSITGIEIHDTRKKDGISHTNKDIDWKKSELNYDLCENHNTNFVQAVNERIKNLNLKKAVRKDAVKMAQVLVTSDHSFFENLSYEKSVQFFEDSYKFLCKKYGKENVISAIVHLDEHTPHMHFNFVPVTKDDRLSAKSILTRTSLSKQHTEFYNEVGINYGLERGVEGGKQKHLETADYKLKCIKQEIKQARKSYENALQDVQVVKDSIIPLQAEYASKQAYISSCEKCLHEAIFSMPEYVETKKSLFGKETVIMPLEKWKEFVVGKTNAEIILDKKNTYDRSMDLFKETLAYKKIEELTSKNIQLEEENKKLKKENEELSLQQIKEYIKREHFFKQFPQLEQVYNRESEIDNGRYFR